MKSQGSGWVKDLVFFLHKGSRFVNLALFLLPNKTEWAIVYCPLTICLHFAACCTHCTDKLDLYTREIPYGGWQPCGVAWNKWAGIGGGKLHTSHYVMHTAKCTLRTTYCKLHTAHYILHTTYYTQHTTQCTAGISLPRWQFCENTLNIIYITPTLNESNNLHIPFRHEWIRVNCNFM